MKRTLALALGVALVGAAQAQVLVYDALSTGATVAWALLGAGSAASIEGGDQVLLGGAATLIKATIVIQFNDDGNHANFNINDTLTFRNVIGTGSSATIDPGAPIYQATYGLSGVAPGAYAVSFGLPNINVPQEFVVTDTFARVSGNSGSVGEHFNNVNPAIGYSDNNYFWVNSPPWAHANFGAPPTGNMRMSLTAVPEPASMAVLGIGALALIRRRRSRRA